MPKRETKIPRSSWTKPAVRRITSGSAEFGGVSVIPDGSGVFS